LSGPLCDAVTGRDDGKAVVEALERENVFVVPLDDRRQWFRYHHLFADVLRAHLLDEHPDQVPELHRRASIWHVKHGDRSEAIRHALAASDFSTAADQIELALPAMRRSRQEARLLGWLRALPDDVIRRRPVLSVDYAGLLLVSGELVGVEPRLRDAELWLDPASGTGDVAPSIEMVVVDHEEFCRLPGAIDLYRAGQALVRGDVAGTMRHAGRALDRFALDDDFGRGAAAGLLGLASWTTGDLVAGHRMYAECMSRLRRAGFIADTFGCALALADIRIAQGRLHEAMGTYERALQLATEHGAPVLRGTADMYVGMSELHREHGDLDRAIQRLLKSKDLGDDIGLPQNPYRWCVAMARIREAQGHLDGALDLLLEAERLYVGDFFPNVRPVAAMKIRLWIAQGRLGEAFGWVREQGLSADDDLTYVREFEHMTLARVLVARYTSEQDNRAIQEAIGLLDRLLAAAEAGERAGSVIQVLVLQALAHEAQGAIPAALRPLERALAMAESEGYVRIFVDEGAPMARLLTEASTQGIAPRYSSRLLEAFPRVAPTGERNSSQPSVRPAQALADPLSEREIEVLRLVAEGLSNREISERLFLALDTVKGHNRRIFAKLGVQRRTEALSRARDLDLL
jgi:LuxR family maltose regulon positive regulatory protein